MMFRLKFLGVMFGVLFVLLLGADWLFLGDMLTVTNELQCAAVGSILVAKVFFAGSSVVAEVASGA